MASFWSWKKVSIFIVSAFLILGGAIAYLYGEYKEETSEFIPDEFFIKDEQGRLIPIEKEVLKDNRQGASNPAYGFKNKSDPSTLVYYFDHDGKILAYNLTLTEHLFTSGNITADYGFFNYLGKSASRITEIFVTDVDATKVCYDSSCTHFTNATGEYWNSGVAYIIWNGSDIIAYA